MFALQVGNPSGDIAKDLRGKNVKVVVIPKWLGSSGMQHLNYPAKEKGIKPNVRHFQFSGASGDVAFNDMKENFELRFELSKESGHIPGFKEFKLAYKGALSFKEITKLFPKITEPKADEAATTSTGSDSSGKSKGKKDDFKDIMVQVQDRTGKVPHKLPSKIKYTKTSGLPPTVVNFRTSAKLL